MHMYTVNVFIKEDLFALYKDMLFTTVAKRDAGYRNGMLTCIYTAPSQSVHIFYSWASVYGKFASEALYLGKFVN